MWSGTFGQLSAEIGGEPAMRLVVIFGGETLYVPVEFNSSHKIAKVIGPDDYKLLIEAYGGITIKIPEGEEFSRLRRVRQVARLLSAGHRITDIAQLLGVSARQVANYRAQAEELSLIPMVFSGKVEPDQIPLLPDAE